MLKHENLETDPPFAQAAALTPPRNTHLAVLSLEGNESITDAGAAALLAALPCCAIRRLDLQGCSRVSDPIRVGVIDACLCTTLSTVARSSEPDQCQNSCDVLELGWFGLRDAHVHTIARALEQNRAVTRLELEANAGITVRSRSCNAIHFHNAHDTQTFTQES